MNRWIVNYTSESEKVLPQAFQASPLAELEIINGSQ